MKDVDYYIHSWFNYELHGNKVKTNKILVVVRIKVMKSQHF